MNPNDLMFKIMKELEKHNFVMYYLKAYSTPSCYIKLDFGVCKSIRISDHKGIDKYKYTFNLMLNLDKSYIEDGRFYYCLDDFDKMIRNIVAYRNNLLEEYGFNYYQTMVDYKNQMLRKRKGFWEKAISFNDIVQKRR